MSRARIGSAHPIAETGSLRAAAANIGKRKPADEYVVAPAGDEECIGEVAALVLTIALDAAAERGSGQVVGGPSRLPRRKKRTACLPQPAPFRVVGHQWRSQCNAVAGNLRQQIRH